MKRLRLYSDDSQQEQLQEKELAVLEKLEEGIEELSKDVEELLEKQGVDSLLDILEDQEETYQSKIKSDENEEIDYFSVSRQLKKKLISYYLNNKSRYRIYSNRRGKLSVDDYIRKIYFELGRKLYSIDTKGAAAEVSSTRMPSSQLIQAVGWLIGGLGLATYVIPNLDVIGPMLKQSPLGFFKAMGMALGPTIGAGITAMTAMQAIAAFIFGRKYTNMFNEIAAPINAAIKEKDLSELNRAIERYSEYMNPKPEINESTEIFLKNISQNKSIYYIKLVYTFEDKVIVTDRETMRNADLGKRLTCVLKVDTTKDGEQAVEIVSIRPRPQNPGVALALLMPLADSVLVQLSTSPTFDDNSVFLEYGLLMNRYVTEKLQISDKDLNRIRDILKKHPFRAQ